MAIETQMRERSTEPSIPHAIAPLLRIATMTLIAIVSISAACNGRAPALPAHPDDPLNVTSIQVLEREACPRLLARTFPLQDPTNAVATSIGRLWVRRCAAKTNQAGLLDVSVDVLGWQWAAESSFGFGVREYVYFTASVYAKLAAEVLPGPKLRVWAVEPANVTVKEIGRVAAHATHFASAIFGFASGVMGQAPNTLATSALRARVRDLIRDRSQEGLAITLGDTPPPGAPEPEPASLLQEHEGLFPGGALLSGSYPPDIATELTYDVEGDGTVLARPVCVDEAITLVDSVVEGKPPTSKGPAPQHVAKLKGRGKVLLTPLPCPWLLVTGVDDAPARLSLSLKPAMPTVEKGEHRWVRATLISYELPPNSGRLIAFDMGATKNSLVRIGQPLTNPHAPAVWLGPANAFEVPFTAGQLVVRASALKPKSRSWLGSNTVYEETVVGTGWFAVGTKPRDERAIPLVDAHGAKIGEARVAIEAMGVP